MQSRGAETVTVPLPPFAPKLVGEAAAVTWHLSALGATISDDVSDEVQPLESATATVSELMRCRNTVEAQEQSCCHAACWKIAGFAASEWKTFPETLVPVSPDGPRVPTLRVCAGKISLEPAQHSGARAC